MDTGTEVKVQSTKDVTLDDLYTKYKKLQQQLEFLAVQEDYIKDEDIILGDEEEPHDGNVRGRGPGKGHQVCVQRLWKGVHGSEVSLHENPGLRPFRGVVRGDEKGPRVLRLLDQLKGQSQTPYER